MNIPVLPCRMQRPPKPEPEKNGFAEAQLDLILSDLEEALIQAWKSGLLGRTTFVGDWSVQYNRGWKVFTLEKGLKGEMASLEIRLRY